ncbi:hypothetical protein BC739_009453 [Kutzneria viridogrisea]|uniref:Uncharacterized protein n=1 Tax=Kutzneria viridogrisea TaxID=47990 RepID=A0ABR6BZ52_9PSEU|nr:hypothetical protein [Kutzneria viridogrisea]
MAGDDEEGTLERRVRQLERDHHLTRWYTGRVDRDLAEIAATQGEHTQTLTSHTGRFDSVDAQLRSLTQMVGEVLRRLPGPGDTPAEGSSQE